jgi:hypothetical protein
MVTANNTAVAESNVFWKRKRKKMNDRTLGMSLMVNYLCRYHHATEKDLFELLVIQEYEKLRGEELSSVHRTNEEIREGLTFFSPLEQHRRIVAGTRGKKAPIEGEMGFHPPESFEQDQEARQDAQNRNLRGDEVSSVQERVEEKKRK